MKRIPRSIKLAALLASAGLIAAACGDDSGDSESTTTGAPATTAAPAATTAAPAATTAAPATTAGATETTAGATETTAAATGDYAMRLTVDLAPEAVWEDGSPITWADLECTWQASLNTPGSIVTAGNDTITSVTAGTSDKQAVIDFKTVYAPYKTLFNPIIKKAAVADCNDISADFQTEMPHSAREYILETWSPEQSILAPNPAWWGDAPTVSKIVMVPQPDTDTELAALKAGETDFSYPQFFGGIEEALADPNIKLSKVFGGDYEGLYFQQKEGPLADPAFRKALALSIDRQALFEQIYVPLGGDTVLQCGPIVPGPYCGDAFTDLTVDVEAASAALTAAGWTQNGSGMWEKDGNVPEIRWMVNAGNTRRENTQAYLIPLLQAAGFNVIADNCDAACVFQQRLPSLDYDIAMYISTAPPDPGYLTPAFACDQIPSPENNNQGQNSQGWCDEAATVALHEADATVDETARAELIKSALAAMANPDNLLMLPLMQFPKSGAYRTDKVGPAEAVEAQFANYRAWNNFYSWEDLDGDGQIVIGAEQWPECLNPVTECANSSWMVWTTSFPFWPGVWDTTNEGLFELTNIVAGEPVVDIPG